MNISMIADQQNCHRTEWEEILHFSLNEKSIIVCCWWPVEADAADCQTHSAHNYISHFYWRANKN